MSLNKADGFRLQQIAEIKHTLEQEREYHCALHKKYQIVVNCVTGVDMALITIGIGIGITGAFTGPAVIILESVAGALGVLGVASKFVNKRLQLKAKKHNEIRVLAESKINTISDLISKALDDNKISDEEFNLILSEVDKYNALKKDIQSKVKKQL